MEKICKLSSNNGPLSEHYPFNVPFTMNKDGVPIFKSLMFSIWRVYLMINKLQKRYKKTISQIDVMWIMVWGNIAFYANISKKKQKQNIT
jgi:hypothetical protein